MDVHNSVDLYNEDLTPVVNQFRHLNEMSHNWKLTHALLTDEDFPPILRDRIFEILDHNPSLVTLKTFPGASVRRFD